MYIFYYYILVKSFLVIYFSEIRCHKSTLFYEKHFLNYFIFQLLLEIYIYRVRVVTVKIEGVYVLPKKQAVGIYPILAKTPFFFRNTPKKTVTFIVFEKKVFWFFRLFKNICKL